METVSAVTELNKKSIEYNVLRREAEADRALWESVLTKLKEAEVTKATAQEPIRIVSHALLPDHPVWPDKARILLLAVFCSLPVGCGIAVVSRMLNPFFRTPEAAEQRLGLPALGVVPKCPKLRSVDDLLVLVQKPGSTAAESFRSLCALSLRGESQSCKTFLFTSAVPCEGKSFCAINCAVAFAQQGLRTLLIEGDLRSRLLGEVFFDPVPTRGLTAMLLRRADTDETIRVTDVDNLSVLCAGSDLQRAPTELFAGNAFGELLARVQTEFDCVVVDSAPVLDGSGALLLARQVPATCLVVGARTPAETVLQAARKLARAGATPIGFIFNSVSRPRMARPRRRARAEYAGADTGRANQEGEFFRPPPEPAVSRGGSGKLLTG